MGEGVRSLEILYNDLTVYSTDLLSFPRSHSIPYFVIRSSAISWYSSYFLVVFTEESWTADVNYSQPPGPFALSSSQEAVDLHRGENLQHIKKRQQ